MPSNTNATGNLEISDLSLPTLNDRLRRIGTFLNGTGTDSSSAAAPGAVNQIVLSVPGMLAVQSNVTPLLELAKAQSFSALIGLLKIAATGSPVTVQMYVGGAAWGPVLTIPAGQVSASANVSSAPKIAANSIIRLDITGVGAALSGVTFPGSDLTVLLR